MRRIRSFFSHLHIHALELIPKQTFFFVAMSYAPYAFTFSVFLGLPKSARNRRLSQWFRPVRGRNRPEPNLEIRVGAAEEVRRTITYHRYTYYIQIHTYNTYYM